MKRRGDKIRVVVLGTRGFPDVQGGIEKHCEFLYPRLVSLGCDVTVFVRKQYIVRMADQYEGVKFAAVWCPRNKYFEAITHTFLGILASARIRPDIIHIHAVGPSILAPLARILGFKVVVTNHGPDYERKKWGPIERAVLKLGERMGSICANEIICVSDPIAQKIKDKYKRDAHVIPHGITIPETRNTEETLKKFNLEKGKYILSVGRFVPEKGFVDLIDAFSSLNSGYKLVIAGRADHPSPYSEGLESKARMSGNVILTGLLGSAALSELYSHARMFVLPSYHEGVSLALLEAISYGLSCIVSDIPANREVDLPQDRCFPPGDVKALAEKIAEFLLKPPDEREKEKQIGMIAKNFNWDATARRTLDVYEQALGRGKPVKIRKTRWVMYIMVLVALLVILIFVYYIKARLNINLFPHRHFIFFKE